MPRTALALPASISRITPEASFVISVLTASRSWLILPVGGGVAEKVCEDCAGPWQWSPDGKTFLYRIPPDRKFGLVLFNLKTTKKTELLKHPNYAIDGAQFSPDNRWIALLAAEGSIFAVGGRLFVVRFQGEEELKESEWIAVTEGQP